MALTIERLILAILVLVVAVETFLALSAYNLVQAQAAKVTAIEAKLDGELTKVRAEAEARVKRVEDQLSAAGIRRP